MLVDQFKFLTFYNGVSIKTPMQHSNSEKGDLKKTIEFL